MLMYYVLNGLQAQRYTYSPVHAGDHARPSLGMQAEYLVPDQYWATLMYESVLCILHMFNRFIGRINSIKYAVITKVLFSIKR
jgi:hypothetical protein